MDLCDAARVSHDNDVKIMTQAITSNLAGRGDDVCHQCGGEIPLSRRKAMPSALLCRGCQERRES